jgi:DNA-binding beta-propeller fold protein YncE
MELWWTPPDSPSEIVPLEVLWTGLGEPPTDALVIQSLPLPSQQVPSDRVAPVAARPGELIVRFAGSWGTPGGSPGAFSQPRGVAFDPAGNILVADMGNLRIQSFSPEGDLLELFGLGAGLSEPFDLVVGSQGDTYVVDPQNDNVAHFGPDGQYRGRLANSMGIFRPRGIGIDSQDNLYIADTGGGRVLKVSPAGQLLAELCSKGEGEGTVRQPSDVAVADDGTVFVIDPQLRLMQRLSPEGAYELAWTIPGANTFDSPHLAILGDQTILATDPEGHRILAFDMEGNPTGEWGYPGEDAGAFAKPIGIAAGPNGLVVVSDLLNHRLQTFVVVP